MERYIKKRRRRYIASNARNLRNFEQLQGQDEIFVMKDSAAVEKAIGKGAKKMLYWK